MVAGVPGHTAVGPWRPPGGRARSRSIWTVGGDEETLFG